MWCSEEGEGYWEGKRTRVKAGYQYQRSSAEPAKMFRGGGCQAAGQVLDVWYRLGQVVLV